MTYISLNKTTRTYSLSVEEEAPVGLYFTYRHALTTYTSFPGKYRIYDLLFCISRDLNLGIALAIFVKGQSLNLYTLF